MRSSGHPFLERSRRPSVLYVVAHHDYSGAELMQLPVLRADPDPLLACPPGSRVEAWARALGVPTVPLPFRRLRQSAGSLETVRSVFRGLATAASLRKLLRGHPERRVLYCVTLRSGMVATIAKVGLGRGCLWLLADPMPPAPLAQCARMLARGCDRAIALSEGVAAGFPGRSRALRDRTNVVYPGVELHRFGALAPEPGAPRAAIIGQINPVKRLELALDVARRVADQIPAFELEIIGRAQFRESDFAYEEGLRRRVSQDGLLARHVRFAGYSPDVAVDLPRFGLLLHCRPDEPLGMVVTEAMAAGLPVVAPDAAGPAEIVEHGVTGLLFRPGDAREAAAHVITLIRDPAAARRMGAAARARVEHRFGAARQASEIDRVLAQVAGDLDRR